MKDRFTPILIRKDGDTQTVEDAELGLDDLMEGDVVVSVSHSTVNYKDGLGHHRPLAGRAQVPDDPRHRPGRHGRDLVASRLQARRQGAAQRLSASAKRIIGGYSEVARVKGDWLVQLPSAFSPAEAMAIGTAGYTAMLCVLALEDAGVTPDKGAVVVTGAAGGVGSVAVAVLAKLGYRVIASTGRTEEEPYLKALGAAEIIPRTELSGETKTARQGALGRRRRQCRLDNAGQCAGLDELWRRGRGLRTCRRPGPADLASRPSSCAASRFSEFDSVYMPMARRRQAWERLAQDLDPKLLASMTRMISLKDVTQAAEDILAGKVRGRLVVEIGG